MKVIARKDGLYVLRFDAGEEVLAGLGLFAKDEGLHGAHFTAIGAAGELVLSYYDLDAKQYEDHALAEEVEVVGITGNIAWMEHAPVVHAHGVFSRRDLSTLGGHVKRLVVSATVEVHIYATGVPLLRGYDDVTGLNLLQ